MHARQKIILSGLNSSLFAENALGILNIHSMIRSALPFQSQQEWKPQMENNMLTLGFTNRYFTFQKDAESQDIKQFPNIIDPFHILQEMGQKNNGVYTEDNEVQYYERFLKNKKNDKMYLIFLFFFDFQV